MPSRLSSLLVRDGLVGVKRMEKAFQRQVIYGGSLDTILLEMALVPEERLTQYLSLSSGLPPATRDETNVFDADAVRRLPEDVAHQFRVAPLCVDGDALRVLVSDPVDMSSLEELADAIDVPIQPLIVPEYRWHVVYARAYGVSAPARYTTLAKQVDAQPPTLPVGKPRTVIVEPPSGSSRDGDSGVDHVIVDVRDTLPPAARAAAAVAEPADASDAAGAGADVATPGPAAALAAAAVHTGPVGQVPSLRPVGPESNTLRMAAVPEPAADDETQPTGPIAADAAAHPPGAPRTRTLELSVDAYAAHLSATEDARRDAERRHAPAGGGSGPSAGVPREVAPQTSPGDAVIRSPLAVGDSSATRQGPMSAVVAREALQVADDRDQIFLVLLRALRSRARYAGLLTVQGGAAIGRLAIAEGTFDVATISSVLIPLDEPSAFRTAVTTQHPHVGPIATGDPEVDGMLGRLGELPRSALILPIVLRDRVVAVAVAHRGDDDLGMADVVELLPLGAAVADALGRLIVRHKAAGYRAPEAAAPAVVEVSVDDVATKRVERPATAWRIPTAPAAVPIETGTEVSVTAEPARPVAELLDTIAAADEGRAEAAIGEAIDRADEVVPALAGRFPGKLRVDRYQVSGRALRAAQYGGLLELMVRLGPPVSDLVVEKMGDPHRDVRFYATVCAAELRPRSAVYALVERLFDVDYGVRAAAMEALIGYPLRDLDAALARARHALHSEDAERVQAAATAIAELTDIAAIPDLLDVVGRDSRRAEHARRALSVLSKQDFGTSERKWRRWWDEHRTRNRIEWLIEGLVHKDVALRQAAAEDLRKLTGEHFGYHHDLPKRDREQAHQRWRQWWQETGRRRFAHDDDERLRPTGMLPQLKE